MTARKKSASASPPKFTLMHNDQIVECFDTYGEALDAGYKRFGLAPFLVQEIGAPPLQFTRDHFIATGARAESEGVTPS
jgi:hypothetical protein